MTVLPSNLSVIFFPRNFNFDPYDIGKIHIFLIMKSLFQLVMILQSKSSGFN